MNRSNRTTCEKTPCRSQPLHSQETAVMACKNGNAKKSPTKVESIRHQDKRKNIPTE